MRKLSMAVFMSLTALAGCTKDQLTTACVVDGVVQPIVVAVGVGVAPYTGPGNAELATQAAVSDSKAHAAVQGACAAMGGAAVMVPDQSTTTPVTGK